MTDESSDRITFEREDVESIGDAAAAGTGTAETGESPAQADRRAGEDAAGAASAVGPVVGAFVGAFVAAKLLGRLGGDG